MGSNRISFGHIMDNQLKGGLILTKTAGLLASYLVGSGKGIQYSRISKQLIVSSIHLIQFKNIIQSNTLRVHLIPIISLEK